MLKTEIQITSVHAKYIEGLSEDEDEDEHLQRTSAKLAQLTPTLYVSINQS